MFANFFHELKQSDPDGYASVQAGQRPSSARRSVWANASAAICSNQKINGYVGLTAQRNKIFVTTY